MSSTHAQAYLNDPKSPESFRQCNSCNACCVHVPVNAPEIGLQKPIGMRCRFLGRDNSIMSGCLIHESRLREDGTSKVSPGLLPVLHQDAKQPACCREYECGYKLGFGRGPEFRPDKLGILFEEMAVHVGRYVDDPEAYQIRFLMGFAFRDKENLKHQFGVPQIGGKRYNSDVKLYQVLGDWLDREVLHYAAAIARKFPEQDSRNIIPYVAPYEGIIAGGIADKTPVVRCVASVYVPGLDLPIESRLRLGIPSASECPVEAATSEGDYFQVRRTIEQTLAGQSPLKMKDGDFFMDPNTPGGIAKK